MKNSFLRSKASILVCLLVLSVLSCQKDTHPDIASVEQVPSAIRFAINRQGVANVFGEPAWESMLVYGESAFTVPLRKTDVPNGWELLLIATLDGDGVLHKAVILRPEQRNGTCYEYSFTPEGVPEYLMRIENSRITGVKIPTAGRSSLRQQLEEDPGDTDLNGEWCFEIDECVVRPPIKEDPEEVNPGDGGGSWWDKRPDGNTGGGDDNNFNPGYGGNEAEDPCKHAQNMNNDQAAQERLADYKKNKIGSIEYGYMVDKYGNVKHVVGNEDKVPLVPEAGKKYNEVVHTHPAGNLCAISPGDVHYIYKELYKPGFIDGVGNFRFAVLMDDHAFSIQITDVQAFKAFSEKNRLDRNKTAQTKINDNMIDYFRGNGIIIEDEIQNPTVSANTMTDMFARFFNDSNSGLSTSKGTYDPVTGQPAWEALEVQGANVKSKDCN